MLHIFFFIKKHTVPSKTSVAHLFPHVAPTRCPTQGHGEFPNGPTPGLTPAVSESPNAPMLGNGPLTLAQEPAPCGYVPGSVLSSVMGPPRFQFV